MRRLISEQAKLKMYEMYKVDGMRAQDIADLYQCSVQHVLKIFRIIEGKPVWTKGQVNAIPGKVQSSAFRKKGFRNDYYEEEPYNERTNTYTHGAKRVDAGIYSDK